MVCLDANMGCGQKSTATDTAESNADDPTTLPASAAGTSSPDGPGIPKDFAGRISDADPVSALEQSATEASIRLVRSRQTKPEETQPQPLKPDRKSNADRKSVV